MGNNANTKRTSSKEDEIGEDELPYLCCLEDVEKLDWRHGLSEDEILKISKEQANMPVEISPRLYLSDRRGAHNLERLGELRCPCFKRSWTLRNDGFQSIQRCRH